MTEQSDNEQDDSEYSCATANIDNSLESAQLVSEFELPNHYPCSAHTLNLSASHNLAKISFNRECSKFLHSTMAKCTALWNKL